MNKKHAAKKLTGVLAGLLSAVILFGELSLGVLANFEVKVSAGSAKIRASADTTSNVLASVKSGDKLDAIEEVTGSDGSTWYKVNIDANTKGYIRSDLVSKTSGSSSSSTSTAATTTTTTTTTTVAEPAPATTDVTAIAAQSATVTSNTVNVRKQASTSASAVAKLNKGAVVTATGTAKGSDGKTWYQVTFINNGSEVTGFIREDLMQLGEAAAPTSADTAEAGEAAGEAVAAEETTSVEAEPEPVQTPAPALPEGVKNYELKYTEGTDGTTDWYVYNNTDGYRMKLDELIQAQATSQTNQKKFEKQASTLRLILIILAVLFAAALTAAVIFFLKYRAELYEYDDEDDDDYDDGDEDDEDEDEDEEDEDDDVKIAPSRNARPTHPQGAAPHQGRPTAPGGARPAGQGQRPAGQGQRPAGQGQRPAGQGQRPAGQGQRPAGQGQRPAGQGQRPAGQGQRPAGAAPAGQQRPRPENGAHAAGNGRNVTPAQTRRPAPGEGAQGAAKKNEMPWKSKNFLNEDEDLDFSFIDDDDLN